MKVAAGFRKIKGQQLDLRRSPAIQRRFVSQHMILHIGHGRAAQDQHQFGTILILVNQQLQGGSETLGGPGHIGVFVDGQDQALLLGQPEYHFQGSLKREERHIPIITAGIFHDAFAEVLQVLLGVALDAHEINRGLAVDEMVDQRGFSHTAAAVKNDKFKLVGIV